jgi:pyrroloquinoline-quinone synthase
MDQKNHWAWSHFAGGDLSKSQLKIHFQQEYEVYVRDFPVFLARIHGQNPPADVRGMLAENIYEEDTGKLSLGKAHPELFLTMMKGLGFRNGGFTNIDLLPASRRYRRWLDVVSNNREWVLGAAVLTIFVEGSLHDRRELHYPSVERSPQEIEAHIQNHPLVQYHGLSPSDMDLSRAHQMVENGHRQDAYHMVVNHATDTQQQQRVLAAMHKSLDLWLRYRNGIAQACRLLPQ